VAVVEVLVVARSGILISLRWQMKRSVRIRFDCAKNQQQPVSEALRAKTQP